MAMDTGTVILRLAPGLQEVVRTALKEVLPDAVEKTMASGRQTRAQQATEHATKKEREAREQVVKHEATIASMEARLIALKDRLEAAEDVAREAQARRVKAESLLQQNAAKCDRALSILNQTYGQGPGCNCNVCSCQFCSYHICSRLRRSCHVSKCQFCSCYVCSLGCSQGRVA